MDDPRNGGDLIHMPSAHLRTFKALLDSMRADSISNPDDILRSVGLSEIGLEELHRRMRAETGEEIRVQLGLAASLLAFDLAIAGRDTHLLIRSIYTFANYCNSAARLRLNRLQPLKASAYAQVAKILFGVLNNPRFGPSMDYASRI